VPSPRVLLISLYELGRQPFGVASAAAWLGAAGCGVGCVDLAVETLSDEAVRDADVIAVHLPMHTATRMATALVPRLRVLNPSARLCFFGLYAPMNATLLHSLGAHAVLGGEFEQELVAFVLDPSRGTLTSISLARQQFLVPDRSTLPALDRYARLQNGDVEQVAGYTEATRGCMHRCRHCPVVPVYDGAFRIVQRDVVLADIAQQVDAGAEHITFGDPDFFNGPEHGMRIVRAVHAGFPHVTYDVTIKVEHLLRHRDRLAELRDTGCLFVTTAAETVDDAILERLDKGHTREDFLLAVHLARRVGLRVQPTFVPFTPWTTIAGYVDLLDTVAELDLAGDVAPVQYAIRLLVPAGSRLLELPELRAMVGEFDDHALSYRWEHRDPAVDQLQRDVLRIVGHQQRHGRERGAVFEAVRACALQAHGAQSANGVAHEPRELAHTGAGPHLSEPWFC
jgi:radical SAM superfamily enzyme YgiQ (UPF0313 family)